MILIYSLCTRVFADIIKWCGRTSLSTTASRFVSRATFEYVWGRSRALAENDEGVTRYVLEKDG